MPYYESVEEELRALIEQARRAGQEHPEISQVERIKQLSRKHYELTGASGEREF